MSIRHGADAPTRVSLSEHLQAVTEALAAAHTGEAVFEVVLTPALAALDAVAGAVLLVDGAGTRLEIAATQGHEEGAQTLWQDGPLDGNVPAGDALERHEALFFEQEGELVRAYPELEARMGGVAPVASAVLPMFLDDAPLGVILLDFKEPHTFTPEEGRFLRTLAAQAALALGRVRLMDAQAHSVRAWRDSHERLVLTLHAGGFGLWELDVRSGLIHRTPETMRLLGLPTPVGPLSEYLSRVHPDDRPEVERAFARAGEDGGPPHFILRHRFHHEGGREVWLEQHSQVERDGAGRAVRFVGVTADITERRRAEGQTQASELRFRRMVEASPVAIAAGDASGRLSLVNDAYLRLLGFARSEFEAGEIDWASLTPAEYREADERAIAQALGRGASDPYEKEMRSKGGERLPLRLVLMRYEDGEQALVVGYLQDLRLQRRAEATLRGQSAELERQVAARTQELEAARTRAEVLAALGDALQRATSPEEVAELALGTLGPALRAQSMLVVRVEGEGGLRLPVLWGETPEAITAYMARPGLRLTETPILLRSARSGQGIYLGDYRAEPGTLASFPALAGGVEPILRPGGTLEGFVVTWRPTELGAWLDAERDLLRRAAGTLGLALERAEQARQLQARRDEQRRRAQALSAFAELSRDLVLETDPLVLIRRTQETVLGLLSAGFSVYFEPREGLWRIRSQVGHPNTPELQAALDAGLPFEDAANMLIPWRTGQPHYQDEYDPAADHLTGSDEYPGATVTIPVRVGGQARGVLGFALYGVRSWSGEDRAVLETVGRQLTLALERAEQTRRVEEEREALAAFARFTERSTHTTEALTLAEGARDVLRATLNVQVGYSELEGGLWKGRVFSENTPPEVMAQARRGFSADLPSFARPFAERDVVFVDGWDARAEGADHTGMYGATALYPYLAGGRPQGLLTMGLPEARAWTERERSVFRSVGRSLGLALERAEGVTLLAQRTQELERSNAELEQFAYVASHDLQAPIRAVTSFAGVIDRRYGSALDDRGRLYLRQIVESGEHMKRLVDDLLAFSRVHTERRALLPVDSGRVLGTVAHRLQAETPEATIRRGELPVVLADAGQLDQLLQNLIGNGLKYHRKGVAPHVHVTAEREGEMWRFAVSDNGIGIEAQYFDRIFVIFQRLHSRETFEGTGIGLAVCKKIVERHGGRLWLESTPGQGSTFFFTLPGG